MGALTIRVAAGVTSSAMVLRRERIIFSTGISSMGTDYLYGVGNETKKGSGCCIGTSGGCFPVYPVTDNLTISQSDNAVEIFLVPVLVGDHDNCLVH